MKNSILISVVLVISFIISCKNQEKNKTDDILMKIEGNTQGTYYHITYKCTDSTNYKIQIDSILHDFDMSLSTYIPTSIISRINKGEENVEVDNYFKQVFLKAIEVTGSSNGAFDITVGPLVNAWGFGPTAKTDVNKKQIDSILQFVGMEKVKLTNNRVIKSDPRIKLDPNALAQGYSVDIISAYLESKGILNYIVEIGGELKVKGKKTKIQNWKLGIDRPVDGNMNSGEDLQTIIELPNKAMATSGNYRKFYIDSKGKKYAHHINPKTGYPEQHDILSATIITDDCLTADAFGTACIVSGLEKTKKMVESNKNLDVYIIYVDENGEIKIWMTPNVQKWITN